MATPQNNPVKLTSVTVRMYRPGLGDCFLLTFRGKQGTTEVKRYMLIDCGVLSGTSSESERLGKIIEDIQRETNGMLHTLVVTHEHADHLSGFGYHKGTSKTNQIQD
jgi:glyoxylase-like metal-dependent hydrolase (beta-lactamase superfamily II)